MQPRLEDYSPCPGVWLCRTPAGIPVFQVRYFADPEKDAAWAVEEKKKFTTGAYWEKEMEGNAYALEGQVVYPEFSMELHVIPDERVPKHGCRYMSIDPHPRTPHAMLWLLIDQWGDWYVYRDFWPSVVAGQSKNLRDTDRENTYTIKDYAETIAYLEGNRLSWHNAETPDEYAVYSQQPQGERIVYRFMDQAGKAFKATDEAALTETYARRYDRYGVQCVDPRKAVQAGEDAIRDLLKPRWHEFYGVWPKLHIAASTLTAPFGGELVMEFQRHRYKSTRHWNDERELKQEGVESRRHQLDNLRYLALADGVTYIPSLVS